MTGRSIREPGLKGGTTGLLVSVFAGGLAGVLASTVGCGSDASPAVSVPGSGMVQPPADANTAAGSPQGTTAVATPVEAPPVDAPARVPERAAPEPVSGTSVAQAGSGAVPPPLDTAPEAPIATAGNDPWCDTLSVFRTSCQSCHGDELVAGAPMSLVRHADVMASSVSDPGRPVHELIGARIHDVTRPMPPLSHDALSQADIAVIDTWLSAGAPDTRSACAAAPVEPKEADREPEWPSDCEERYEIRVGDASGGQPYTVPANTEEDRNFTISVPWTSGGRGPVQALAIRPLTSNKRVVHHWILYAGTDFITSWSPGKPMETFPEDVGVHMPTSGTFRLNMHYYNVGNSQPEPDNSGLEVCITRNPRRYTATTYMFAGSASVPPASKVENVAECQVRASEPVHLITSSPHMHQYGVHAKLEIVRSDGSVEVLEDAPFNWEDQHVTPIDGVVQEGDRIRITCVYENDTEQAIRFGSSSEDEMCFNFARYYPMDAFQCVPGAGLLGGFF